MVLLALMLSDEVIETQCEKGGRARETDGEQRRIRAEGSKALQEAHTTAVLLSVLSEQGILFGPVGPCSP